MTRPNTEYTYSWYHYGGWDQFHTPTTWVAEYNPDYRYYEGTRTPGFHDHRAEIARKIFVLPYNLYLMEMTRIATTRVEYHNSWRSSGEYAGGSFGSAIQYTGINPFDDQPETLVQEVKNRVASKMQSQLSGVRVNLAQFFAERKQCAEMLASTATRVSQAALALKRADLRGFMQSLSLSGTENRTLRRSWKRVERTQPKDRIASHWLEYVYGWKPLLSDIYSSAELLADSANRPGKTSGYIRANASKEQVVANRPPGTPAGIWVRRVSSHKVGVVATMRYTLQSEARSMLAQTGISNPALLAWELLPYSFVIDWFYPVGKYLESLTAFDGFDVSSGFTSILERTATTREVCFLQDPGSPYVTTFSGGVASMTKARLRRTTEFLVYRPVLKSPIGGEPLSRFLTAASLLINLFGKPIPRV